MEAEPVRFMMRELEPLWDASRDVLAGLLGADPADLVFVRNATEGVGCVLQSLAFAPGDKLLVTDHAYNACRNAVEYVAARAGAEVVVARVPLQGVTADGIVDAILSAIEPGVRLALLDHVTSPTALVFPIQRLAAELNAHGIDALVDGAHAPGMLPLDVARIGAAYYAGNCHKWLCAPKGAGFLHVRRDRQQGIQPAVISHGYNTRRPDRPRLHVDFDWTGTSDPTAALSVGRAIGFLGRLTDGGLAELMRRNHELAAAGRRVLCDALDSPPLGHDDLLGSMAAVALPEGLGPPPADEPWQPDPLSRWLLDDHGIEAPVYTFSPENCRLLRISAQAYNHLGQYERLAAVLRGLM
jgi:isopenicillin-N epimerase